MSELSSALTPVLLPAEELPTYAPHHAAKHKLIREYANERTCLVISHDLNFVAAVADRILVIDKGKIVDQGAHDELISREGLYKTLYGLKNVDPSLLRTRNDRAAAAQPGLPGGALPGIDMPGAGGMNMPPGMSMGI